MIEAVLFDWGGVLIDLPTPEVVAYCSGSLGISEEQFYEASENYWKSFQIGKLTEEEYLKKITGYWDTPIYNFKTFTNAFNYAYRERKEMFNLVSVIQSKGCKTALLSNTEPPGVELFKRKNYQMFDETIFSCVEGTRKPDPEIYEISLERLAVRPGNSIFIDDKEENIIAAIKLGINSIHHKNFEQTQKELIHLIKRSNGH